MCENYWEPLAEVYITEQAESLVPDDYIYCLCSRVFIRNPDVYTVLASEDVSEGEDNDGDCIGEMLDPHKKSVIETQSVEKHDEEPVSCYCSASHTDNNYSTDEHDSVRDSVHRPSAHTLNQKLGLHQSDSGADLSEYHDQHEAKSIQNLIATYGKTFQTTETETEDNYKHTDVLTNYNEKCDSHYLATVHSSDNCIIKETTVLDYNPYSKKDKYCTDDSTLFTLGDKESMAQSLSDSITMSHGESFDNKDLISFTQYDCNSYTYPYPTYYENTKSAMDIAWEKYWGKNGEQLIWTSWIEKYADYINPGYFQDNVHIIEDKLQTSDSNEVAIEKYSEQNTCFPNQAHKNCELLHSNFAGIFNSGNSELKPSFNTSFSFEQINRQEINDKDADENRKKITNFELSPEAADGWNPLSPFSVEEDYNQHSNAEDERLLTRCDSINGSIAKTNATSDSMTNVTKMTLSSSSCDSNSVHSSSLISSVTSSIESNITSSSSDQENEFTSEDNDKYWQHLWKENFQIQYQKQYELFIANYKIEHSEDCVQTYSELIECEDSVKDIENNQSDKQNYIQNDTNIQSKINISKNKSIYKKKSSKSEEARTKKLIMESVGMLMRNLSMKSENEQLMDAEDKNMSETKQQTNTISSTITQNESETTALHYYAIGNSRHMSSGGDGDKPHEDKPFTLKRCHEADYESSSEGLETVKKAFSLMGYTFSESNHSKLQGEVVYRKRNIRSQNRQLKMNFSMNRMPRPKLINKHIRFDDNGDEIVQPIDKVKQVSSCFPPSSAEFEKKSKDEVLFTKVELTSSSDEECESNCITKLQTKKLTFNKSSTSSIESLDIIDDTKLFEEDTRKTQKKKRRKQVQRNMSLPKEIMMDKSLMKYWIKRYKLFSKFDEGIKLDHESWFSVTPERIAIYTAIRCRCDVIIDAFCGAGGNSIQFAFMCDRVISIDIDPVKIELARHNAKVYGVEDRIQFIVGDFFQLAPELVGDVVFLSPPWGGPEYIKQEKFNLDNILPPIGGVNLFKTALQITKNIAYFLPRNVDTMQLINLTGAGRQIELEQQFVDRKLVTVTAYYGNLARVIQTKNRNSYY